MRLIFKSCAVVKQMPSKDDAFPLGMQKTLLNREGSKYIKCGFVEHRKAYIRTMPKK